jgi:glycosyltransferase involved in cell wall biosynthesis
MRAPRVLFVVDGALDQPTGGYIYDRRVVGGLRDRGLEVEVASLDPRRAALASEDVRAASLVMRHLAAGGLVVVDELSHPRVLAVAVARATQRTPRRGRLMVLVHHLGASERRGLAVRARLAVERPLLAAADGLVVTSETTREAIVAVGVARERVRVVRPGRDRLGERDAPPEPAADGALRLLFVGALAERKGPLDLLAALARQPPHVRATLVGPADRDPFHAARVLAHASLLGGRVRVTGGVSDEALARAFAEHDVLVLPSRYEGFGIVLAEAMAHGLAIVATRRGAIAEVARDGREALLVSAEDPSALAAALGELTRDPARLRRMQHDALGRARELPAWRDTEQAFADALLELAAVPHVVAAAS